MRRRRLGESPEVIAADLGRTSRWVRNAWLATMTSRTTPAGPPPAPGLRTTLPTQTPDELRQLILDARARLVANPRAQYGALAIAWELRHMGVEPIPERWTIEREIARSGLARARRRQPGYVPTGVPYPARLAPEPGTPTSSTWSVPVTWRGRWSSTPSTASTSGPTPRQ